MWITSATGAEATFATGEATKIKARDQLLAEHEKIERVAIAGLDRTAANAATTATNAREMGQLLHNNAREAMVVSAWVVFTSAQHVHAVTADATLVTELRDLPWANFVHIRAQGLEAAWEETKEAYISLAIDQAAAKVTAQQATNEARTTHVTAVAQLQYTLDTAAASAKESQDKSLASHLAQSRIAEVAGSAGYQVAFAQAARNHAVEMSEADYWRDINGSPMAVSQLELAAQSTRLAAEKDAREALGIVQAATRGAFETANAASRLLYVTASSDAKFSFTLAKNQAELAFVEAKQDAQLTATVTTADLVRDFNILGAQQRQDQLGNLVINFTPTVGIGPWAAYEGELASVLQEVLEDIANETYGRVVTDADALYDRVMSEATAKVTQENAAVIASATHDVALANADWQQAVSDELADNVLASLGGYSADIPKAPEQVDLTGLPSTTSPSHSHDFKPNDITREPYAAIIAQAAPYYNFAPNLFQTFLEQAPVQLTTDRLLESVIHTDDPHLPTAASRYRTERLISHLGKWVPWKTIETTTDTVLNTFLGALNNALNAALIAADGEVDVTSTARRADAERVAQETAKANAAIEQARLTIKLNPADIPEANLLALQQAGEAQFWARYISRDIGYVQLYSFRMTHSDGVERIYIVRYYGMGTTPIQHDELDMAKVARDRNYSWWYGASVWVSDFAYQSAQSLNHSLNSPGAWILMPISYPATYGEKMAAEHVFSDLEEQATAQAVMLAELTVHMIPVVGAIDHISQGNYKDGAISLVGDLALGAGAWAKALKAAGSINKANAVHRYAATAEMGIAGFRGIEAAQAAFNGSSDNAAMYFGEAVLRLFGAKALVNAGNAQKGKAWLKVAGEAEDVNRLRGNAASELPADYSRRIASYLEVKPRNVPYGWRTPDLPDVLSMDELVRILAIPGREGVTLSSGSISRNIFAQMWHLSDNWGIEYGLTKELLEDGSVVWRLYSGSSGKVEYKALGTILGYGGHTHPSHNPFPSYFFDEDIGVFQGDIETLNRLWRRQEYKGRIPHSRVIWGPERTHFTRYFPNEGR